MQPRETIEALTLREQVLLRPVTYLGSIQTEKIVKDIYQQGQIQPIEFDYNHGLFQIFVEIISNAVDNVTRSRKFKINPGEIHVNITSNEIKVTNWGYSIPIVKHHTLKDQYVPQVAFFNLLTSSNYDDKQQRKSSGRNGLGSKLTNMFSKKFKIQVYNDGKYFELESSDNLSVIGTPIVRDSPGKPPFSVCITFTPDFERFGVPAKFTPEFLNLVEKYTIDAAAITGVKTLFNGKVYKTDFLNYVHDYYYPDDEELSFTRLPKIVPATEDDVSGFSCELLIVEVETPTPDVSFVNGVVTDAGGNHIKTVWDALWPELAKRIKSKFKFEANQTQVRKYFRLFLNAELYNPAFGSQSKAKLVSKVPKINIPAKTINTILEWKWVDLYHEFHKLQNQKIRAKTDGKKVAHVNVEKAVDANLAGKKESSKCTLIITEGDSAKTFAVNGRSAMDHGTDYYGVYPIRGKGLNTMNAKEDKINDNKEIKNIKILLGLKTGVDYSLPENRKKLRYGKVMVLSDADDDGLHIRGLTMLIFAELFVSLLDCGFIQFMETPVVRVYKNRKLVEEFYTYEQFEKWSENSSKKSYEIRHIKGLGTSRPEDQKRAFQQPFFVDLDYTEACPAAIQLAFNKKLADARKKWLATIEPRPDPVRRMSISTFIHDHFKHFSWADTSRNIPTIDGLKPSQRKCIWVAFHQGMDRESADSKKLANFQGDVASKSEYDHNPNSLSQAVILMAQTFPGTNNLPYFVDDGNYGNRLGEDPAASRYLFTSLHKYTSMIINKLDDSTLKHVNHGGKDIEPFVYYPIICMPLVNGLHGIGTGYSCFIHSYNPQDVIRLHKEWLDFVEKQRTVSIKKFKTPTPGEVPQATNNMVKSSTPMVVKQQKSTLVIKKKTATSEPVAFYPSKILPYFKGYRGTVKQEGSIVYMYGVFEIKKDIIYIREIPLKFSMETYKNQLEQWRTDGFITDFNNYGGSDDFYFTVKGYNEEKFKGQPSYETLLLKETLKRETINLLDETHSKVLSFDNIYELLSYYSKLRLKKYEERRQTRITHLKDKYPLEKLRYKFVLEVIEGTLKVSHRDEGELFLEMDERGYPHDFLNMSIRSFTKQKLAELQNIMQKIEDELAYLMKMTDVMLWRKELMELEQYLYPDLKVN